MELKKNPESDIEKKRNLLFNIGLVAALAVVLVAFEWTTFEAGAGSLGELTVDAEEEELVPITQQEIKPPPPPPPKPTVIEIVDDEEEIEDEVELDDTEVDEDTEIEIVEQEEEVVVEPQIFTVVEQMPGFPGGDAARMKYLAKNIKYPPMAVEAGIKGTVYINFTVYEDGSIKNIKILRGIGGGCDEEAVRVVKRMPKWAPGKQRGKAVRVSFNMPIKFSLR